ncbi:hypothetical protein Tco_0234171, partial [Tanacetum coccineum]
MHIWPGLAAGLCQPAGNGLPAGTDVGLFLLPTGNEGMFSTFFHTVLCKVFKSTELEAEDNWSLVWRLEDLTLETQDAKPMVSESEDLSLLSQE